MSSRSRVLVLGLGLLLVGGGACLGVASAHPPGDEEGSAKGEASRSTFHVSGSSVVGRHVSFTLRANAGGIDDLASRGAWGDALIFETIRATPHHAANTTWRAAGDEFHLKDAGFSWHATDHTDAAWRLTAQANTTVRLVVAAGVRLRLEDNGTTVRLTHDGHTAWLRASDGTFTLSGQTIRTVVHKGDSIGFRIAVWHGPNAHANEHAQQNFEARIARLIDRIHQLRDELRHR